MKKVLCDINIILDIFLKRQPFYGSAAKLFKKIEEKELKGCLCALSFPTLFYLLSKELDMLTYISAATPSIDIKAIYDKGELQIRE